MPPGYAPVQTRYPPFSAHLPVLGVAIDWLFESSEVGITRWRCSEGSPTLSREKEQHHFVISFLHAGSFRVATPRGTATMDSNFVLFMNPHEPYRTCHPQSCGDFGSTLVLSPEFIRELLAAHIPRVLDVGAARFPILTRAISNQSYLTQRVLITCLERRAPDSLAVEETCLRAAGLLVREMARSGESGSAATPARSSGCAGRRAQVEAVRDILNRRFRESVLLRDLARAVGCSPYHLCRTFRRGTTLPVHRY